MHRLESLVENRVPSPDAGVQALEHELGRAILVEPEKIAKNVVTMNSRIRIHDLDRNSELVVTIVFPFESNAERNRISVLAPLGTALLGCRVGERVKFNAPGGERRVKIVGIEYQPEAAARQRIASSVFRDSGAAA
jgi:regulator of nucleoside diphosphate kinase